MREIFQALDDLKAKRPEITRSNVWHVEKNRHEEIGELLEVTYNEPSEEQLVPMLSEGADVIINVLQIFQNCGLSPEVVSQAIIDKIAEIGERPPEHFQRGIRMPAQIDIYTDL